MLSPLHGSKEPQMPSGDSWLKELNVFLPLNVVPCPQYLRMQLFDRKSSKKQLRLNKSNRVDLVV